MFLTFLKFTAEEEDDPEEEDVEPLALAGDTSRIEEIPPKEPLYNAMPLKSALKKRPAPSASPAATPLAARQDHHHASFKSVLAHLSLDYITYTVSITTRFH